MAKEEKVMDDIRNTARDIVDKLVPVEDDENDEIDAENDSFMAKAVPSRKS